MATRLVRHLHLPPIQEQPCHQGSLMTIYREELDKFFSLLNTDRIKQLLERDKCYTHVDNYLLAMVFVYFKRSGLSVIEYSVDNFWLCLYLAHDQEEDEEELKWELLPWALGQYWGTTYLQFLMKKDQLWRKMACRSVVSRRQCEQIMALSAKSGAWHRVRGEEHGGAVRRGEGQFVPGGPGVQTPQCVRCEGQEERRQECFLVSEDMDVEEDVDRDSGMETDGELELFPEE
jgi:speedy protein